MSPDEFLVPASSLILFSTAGKIFFYAACAAQALFASE